MFLRISFLLILTAFHFTGHKKEYQQITVKTIEMANFEPIYEKTLKFEGGYQAMPSDSANYNSLGQLVGTKYGISAVAWESYFHRPASVQDIQQVTPELAKKIFKAKYWDQIQGDSIHSQAIADIIFALYIGNPAKSNQITKKALALNGTEISVSNPYSDQVVKAINRTNSQKLFETIKSLQLEYTQNMRAEISKGWTRKISSYNYDDYKKKWLIVSIVLIALFTGSYIAYKKGYHTKMIKKLNL